MQGLAQESGHFTSVTGVDDGYSALAQIWEDVARNEPLPVIIVDRHSVGGSSDVLLAELRGDERTARAYVVFIVPPPGQPMPHVDLVCVGEPAQPEIGGLLDEVASRAYPVRPTASTSARWRC